MALDAAHVRAFLKNEIAFGTTPAVGRVFVVCEKCRRVVPLWRCVTKKRSANQRTGCRCGCPNVQPSIIPEWKAAYWVLVRGLLWRKWILRKAEWEPRLPARADEHTT